MMPIGCHNDNVLGGVFSSCLQDVIIYNVLGQVFSTLSFGCHNDNVLAQVLFPYLSVECHNDNVLGGVFSSCLQDVIMIMS